MKLNEKCSECGKTLEEAETEIPQTKLGIMSGEWICEECFVKDR